MSVRPGAEPFSHDAGDVGVLLLHGFTGNPSSLHPWARTLADAGRTVRVPRLPGHGTTWREMSRTRWSDWSGEAESAFLELRARCRVVVVGGLSMGGALALQLAVRHPGRGPETTKILDAEGPAGGAAPPSPRAASGAGENSSVDGLVLVNPSVVADNPGLKLLPVVRWLTPFVPPVGGDVKKPGVREDAYDRIPPHAIHSMLQGYRAVRADLPAVTAPLLLIRSRQDHVVPAASSALIRERVTSVQIEEVVLENSYHVATLDNDATVIFERTLSFLTSLDGSGGNLGRSTGRISAQAGGGTR